MLGTCMGHNFEKIYWHCSYYVSKQKLKFALIAQCSLHDGARNLHKISHSWNVSGEMSEMPCKCMSDCWSQRT